MKIKIYPSGLVVAASMLIILASGCASSSSSLAQPPATSHMKSAVGTPDELSPLAPAEARNLRKVGNRWLCDLNGKVMFYNDATASWEPQQK
jgi:hypothetical protein